MKIDEYKHLDASYPVQLTTTMPEIVKTIVAQNYGTHRLLSALVHELRAKETSKTPSQLAPAIEELLNKGMFY